MKNKITLIPVLYFIVMLGSIISCALCVIDENWFLSIVWVVIGIVNFLSLKNELE